MQPGLAGPRPSGSWRGAAGGSGRIQACVRAGYPPHAAGRGPACSLPPRWVPQAYRLFRLSRRLLYHLPQQRRDAAARGYDVIGRRTRVWHSRVPACRSGGCPAIHVSGLQQAPAAAQPHGRFSGPQGHRGLGVPGPCMPHGGRGEEWPPCLFAQQPNAASAPDDGPAGPFLANEAPS